MKLYPPPAAALRAALVLVAVAASLAIPPVARAEGAPVVVTARLLGPDPGAPPGEAWYLVEVDQNRHGEVLAGVLAVRLAGDDRPSRTVAAAALESGAPVELTLVPLADGSHRATSVRAVGDARPPDPLPPPLVDPTVGSAGRPGDLRRHTAAVTAGAPLEHQVLEIVNEERLANGNLPPLKGVAELDQSTGSHSFNMADRDFFAHCDPDAPSNANEFFERMTAAGYSWNLAAENIAGGSSTAQGVMAQWMASPGHRSNILSTAYREIGVGYFEQAGDQGNVRRDLNGDCTPDSFNHGPFGHYWTQNFGQRNSIYPVIIDRELYETGCAEVELYTYGMGWAQEMRFSNDNVNWSPWMPFSPDVDWELDPSAGATATVFSELRNGGTIRAANDTIETTAEYPAASDVNLSAQTVSTTESWTACDTITAGDGFHVASNGDVTFTARTIVLTDGFSVADGGSFRAVTH